MKKLLFILFIFCAINVNAQNYLIAFAGTGESSTVNSVKIENLTAATSLTINGDQVLRLTSLITGINTGESGLSSELKIYPNPMAGNAFLQIYPPDAGNATITVYDMTGKPIASFHSYLESNLQEFRISGISCGFYLIIVKGNTYQYSGKLLSTGNLNGNISIEKVDNNIQAVEEKATKTDSKGTADIVEMNYTDGDRLKFTGISGNYSTVKTDIPASDKTITFNFIACTDGDNNNYPVVEIGTQVWMAENLRATRFKDGITFIPLVEDNSNWSNLTTPGYCWYNNNEVSYKATYGALYNWYTVSTGNLCPTGWHVPADTEWTVLTTYLNGESAAGGKLKETGTIHWSSPNSGATNETGYTSLPGGYRDLDGKFYYVDNYGHWWSSTEHAIGSAWYRYLNSNNSYINSYYSIEQDGFSIRCLEDTIPFVTTTSIANITSTSATAEADITGDGGLAVTARGVCWSTSQNPTLADSKTIDGSGIGTFSSTLTSLLVNTKYYVRSYATNSIGTAYGNEISFCTKGETGTVSDIDGNDYSTMEYGTQVWMTENLRTTWYQNGDLIGTTSPATLNISGENMPKYQWAYGGNENNAATYGRLYTWYTTNDIRNICPENGWHVPTDAEWTTLTDYLTSNGYGYGDSGSDIGKSIAAQSGWYGNSTPGNVGNDQATNNSSGFTALPGGSRNINGPFYDIGGLGLWWTASEVDAAYSWYRELCYNLSYTYRASITKKYGFSVRCLFTTNNIVAVISTSAASLITQTTATCGGNVTSDGSATVTALGVCWSVSANPTCADSKTTDGIGTGTFTSSITGLIGGTNYYVRAYATYNTGTAYGNEISFTTDPATVPVITTDAASLITQTNATCGGNVTSDNSALITARGVCWSSSVNPTVEDSKTTNGTGTGTFTSLITGLAGGTTYYVRAYATYNGGTVYGNELSFTTDPATVPIIATNAVSLIKQSTATCGGNVTGDGSATVTTRGVCWSTSQNPTIADNNTNDGTGTGVFFSSLTGLSANMTYYVRAYATNSAGIAYGNEISFTTKPVGVPEITTSSVSSITQTTAACGGNVTNDGGADVTSRGICWSPHQNPTIGDSNSNDGSGPGNFTSSMTDLLANTLYYVRSYATNSVGTAYGNEIFFATRGETGTVSDIDGNTYSTIMIGTQTWMAENLKTTRYSNGDIIGTTTPATLNIEGESTPKYQWAHGGNESNVDTYGRLYTWFAVTDNRNLCPTGWHVPMDAEWTILTTYLGGESTAAGKLKESGTIHWWSPNTGATNETGFTARPSGDRFPNGNFNYIGQIGEWWSSTEYKYTGYAYYRDMYFSTSAVNRTNYSERVGVSVRCVKDN